MASYPTVTDMFCGAGGSGLGATWVGAEVKIAMNHWKLAIESHNNNFPGTDHVLCDISQTDPRWYPRTEILLASPECTNHSVAKGNKRACGQKTMFEPQVCDPSAERSRATAWDDIRYAEVHRYRIIIVENIVDFRRWELWDSWLHALDRLGYEYRVVYANSMFFHPTPQSRDRMYVVAWHIGCTVPDLDVQPMAYCERCGHDVQSRQSWKKPAARWGKYRTQYVYRCPKCAGEVVPYYYCATNAIDWSVPTQRIADRAYPLKAKTLDRIRAGLELFAGIDVTTVDHHALLSHPFLVDTAYTHSDSRRVYAVDEPMPSQTTRNTLGVAVPPFVLSYYTRVSGKRAAIAPLMDALPTQPGWALHYLVEPGQQIKPEDCGFRMLQPHEVQRAMAFPSDYRVLGNQREKIRQLGNAVTPPVIAELFRRCVATW